MYDQKKDKVHGLLEMIGDDGNKALQFSVHTYNNGPPKLQIIRRFLKRDETFGYGNSGRLTIEEIKWLKENIDRIISIMEEIE